MTSWQPKDRPYNALSGPGLTDFGQPSTYSVKTLTNDLCPDLHPQQINLGKIRKRPGATPLVMIDKLAGTPFAVAEAHRSRRCLHRSSAWCRSGGVRTGRAAATNSPPSTGAPAESSHQERWASPRPPLDRTPPDRLAASAIRTGTHAPDRTSADCLRRRTPAQATEPTWQPCGSTAPQRLRGLDPCPSLAKG